MTDVQSHRNVQILVADAARHSRHNQLIQDKTELRSSASFRSRSSVSDNDWLIFLQNNNRFVDNYLSDRNNSQQQQQYGNSIRTVYELDASSLGEPCLSSSQCRRLLRGTHCDLDSRSCACLPYHVQFNQTVCLPGE